ncbi:CDP-glucose 4,6-dehydratase [Helicobacter sp. 23-1044]
MLDIYQKKRVFITGHTGFKGSWLSLWMESLGAEVCGYALPPQTKPNHFALLGGESRFRTIFADIRNKETLQKSLFDFSPHIIFHLAAQPLVRESYKNPIDTFSTNALGTLNVLECARNLKDLCAIVVITTDKVYENKEWIWGYRENDRLGGYDVYSASKACAEIITSAMQKSFFNVGDFGKSHNCLIATARAGNVIGGGDFSVDRIVPDLMRGVESSTATIIRNPNATRPWQFVLEPLRGYLMLGETLLQGDVSFATSFNFAPHIEANISVKAFLHKAQKIWDKIAFKITEDSANPHEANLLMLDSAKAFQMLNFSSLYDIDCAINQSISWYKSHYENGKILSEAQLKDYRNAFSKIANRGGGRT